MTLAEYKEGEFIFKVGDLGDYYCIILKGEVACLVPIQKNVSIAEL